MKERWKRLKANKELLLLSLPGMIWFLLFAYLPLPGVLLAFKRLTLSNGGFIQSFLQSDWVGFSNFKFLFASGDMWKIFRNTVGYNIIFIILGIVLPIIVEIGRAHV